MEHMGRCADTQFETLTEFFNSRPKRGEQRRLTGLQGILVTFAGLGKSQQFVFPILILHCLRPTWEDMIIAYSTIPGYASLR